jgi:hypothetical protein
MNTVAAHDPLSRNTIVRINRREHARYPLLRRQALLHSAGTSEPCVIRNISAAGLMLRVFKPALVDGRVEIELDSGQRLTGEVAWRAEWEIGIAFLEPIDVDTIVDGLSAAQLRENRRALTRTSVSCPVQLRLRTRTLKGRINDISEAGAGVETLRPLSSGTRIELTLPDLPPMTASVEWSKGNSAGVQFDEPLPANVLLNWLAGRLC